jgi:hypothetical protein
MQPLICSGILLRLQDITACAIIASMPCICYAPLLMLSHLSAAAAIHEAGFHLEFSNGCQLFFVYCVVCVALCLVGDPFTVQAANAFNYDGSFGHVALALAPSLSHLFYSAGELLVVKQGSF